MGGGRWTDSDWKCYSTASVTGKSTAEVYSRRDIKSEFNPKGIKVRESRDSADNPESTAIVLGLDVTGSMSAVLDSLIREGVPTLMEEIYSRKPVVGPQILMSALGDVSCDNAPLQVSQFESDIRIAEQLQGMYIEHGGGGNDTESYNLPWYFAAMHTSIDCMEKRGKKGYLFTFGDESTPHPLSAEDINHVFGYEVQGGISNRDLLDRVSEKYHVFHLVIKQGSYARSHDVMPKWRTLLGQNVIPLEDHTRLAEVIVSLIQVTEGADKASVIKSWDGDKSLVVGEAVKGYNPIAKSEGSIILL
jgi:hypothetical protein